MRLSLLVSRSGCQAAVVLGVVLMAVTTPLLWDQARKWSVDGMASVERKETEVARGRAVPPPGSAARVAVAGLEVRLFSAADGKFDRPLGVLGRDVFAARRDDGVTVEARLSRPAYAYLVAFRPDGTEEVCFPEAEGESPPLADRPRYPSVSRGVNYGLNEGEGLQVFAVVASDRPLPPYKEWKERLGPAPWKREASPPGVVWRDDGAAVDALTAENPKGQRGKGREVGGKAPVARLTDWLRKAPEVEAVAAVGFAVLPKEKP